MSITLDDKSVDVFKLYDEMTIAYSKDIEGYKTLIKAIEAMISQKEEMLRGIKDNTVTLVKTSIEIAVSQKEPVRKKGRRIKTVVVNEEAVAACDEIDIEEAVIEIAATPVEVQSQMLTPPIHVQKPKPTRQKKEAGKSKVKKIAKPKKSSKQAEKIAEDEPAIDITALNCLYHPESPVLDKGRQLCASCKWKLINSGLKNNDKDPAVISYLKGETKSIPNVGQPMCPVHPEVPAYNKKTGLCQKCQSKAKAIGVTDRHLTDDELDLLRKPVL